MGVKFSELNIDQVALLKWITAGLAINEVRKLHGDAGYLLNHLIAKFSLSASEYRLSKLALSQLVAEGIDLRETHKRSKLHRKNSPLLMYEHAIPARIVREELFRLKPTQKEVLKVLRKSGPVVIILRKENELLRKSGLNQDMPNGWKWGGNPLARYRIAGINISPKTIEVDGAIER